MQTYYLLEQENRCYISSDWKEIKDQIQGNHRITKYRSAVPLQIRENKVGYEESKFGRTFFVVLCPMEPSYMYTP